MKISSGCTAIWYNLSFSLQAKTYMFNLKRKDYVDYCCSHINFCLFWSVG